MDHGEPEHRPIADMNVTPMVDVMFVLLVLFLVSMPLLIPQTMGIDLPDTQALDSQIPEDSPHRITIHADGRTELNGESVTPDVLMGRLAELAETPEARLLLEADKTVRYERVAQIMVDAQASGITQIGFLTEAKASQSIDD